MENLGFSKIQSELIQTKIVTLFGPPGIGKTSHAIECAYKMKDEEFNVQWFNSETKDKFQKGLIFLTFLKKRDLKQKLIGEFY